MMKVGILGGGQLGRMLLQAAANYPVEVHVMDKDDDCPAAPFCNHFVKGDIQDFDDVYRFGQGLNAIAIEIESVNEDALEKLEEAGVMTYPRANALRIIKNKISQKRFYKEQEIPSPEFLITENLEELRTKVDFVPAVHKIGKGGYDGKGVRVIQTMQDLQNGFDAPAVLEKMLVIRKEISQVIAMNEKGETAVYPSVDMVFDPILHVLDYQISPADLPKEILWKVEAIALKLVKALKSPGIFAVEFFIDHKNEVYLNETAPRVHNSGHHTIEANYCSQFDMLWRVILGYPLGNTEPILPAAMVNLLGSDNYDGEPQYEGLPDVLKIENAFVHIYGKRLTKAGRKMGHVTILSRDKSDLVHCAHKVKNALRVISA